MSTGVKADGADLVSTHYRLAAPLAAACGAAPGARWSMDWRMVDCRGCRAVAKAAALTYDRLLRRGPPDRGI